MRGAIKKTGKRNLSDHGNELEEYFAEFDVAELDPDDAARPNESNSALTVSEEIRRLKAYVAHLGEQIVGFQPAQRSQSKATRPIAVEKIVGFTVMVGIAAAVVVVARRLPRFD
jgi:hypothetical protein